MPNETRVRANYVLGTLSAGLELPTAGPVNTAYRVATSVTWSGAGTTPCAISASAVAGDQLLLVTRSDGETSAPAGWTLIGGSVGNKAWVKKATSADIGASINIGTNGHGGAVIVALSGGGEVGVVAMGTSNTTASVTTTEANEVAIEVFVNNTVQVSQQISAPSGVAAHYAVGHDFFDVIVTSQRLASPGPTTQRAATGADRAHVITFKPYTASVPQSTMSSAALARLPLIDSSSHAAITLTDAAAGEYEVVRVIAHAAGATTATVERGREGSTSRAWPSGAAWQHGPTAADFSTARTLGYVAYGPAGWSEKTTTSDVFVDLDAANLAVTFVAPPSGFVYVMQSARIATSSQAQDWNVREGTTNVAGSAILCSTGSGQSGDRAMVRRRVAVTPGRSYTWKWGHRSYASGTAVGVAWVAGAQEAIMVVELY